MPLETVNATTNTCTCANGVAATGTACTTDYGYICASCYSGYALIGSKCDLPVADTTSTITSTSGMGEDEESSSRNGNETTSTTTSTTDSGSGEDSDEFMAPPQCVCENGVAVEGFDCAVDSANNCKSCDTGYSLIKKYSVYFGLRVQTASTCEFEPPARTCTCSNGVPATGANCTSNNAEICESCDADFLL